MTSLSGSLAGSVAGPLSGPGAGAGAAGDTIEDILGDLLVEYWDARYGVNLVVDAVDSWVGQLNGTVLQAPGLIYRPSFSVDGAYFSGLPVLQFAADDVLVSDVLSEQYAAGTRPWVLVVMRLRDTTVIGEQGICSTSGAGEALSQVFINNGAVESVHARANNGSQYAPPSVEDTANEQPLLSEGGFRADAGLLLYKNGALVASNASADTVAQSCTRYSVGASLGPAAASSIASVMVLSAECTVEQRAALFALMMDIWDLAPSFVFVVAGGSLVTGDGGQIVGGG